MIEVSELTKRYGDKTAVERLTFTVPPGEVTGFLGPNGAGKSTTLRLILGLDRPTSGTATVNGAVFGGRRRGLRHAGALLDAQQVHGGRSAEAHLWALARSNGIPRRRVAEVLAEVGLAEAARRRVGGFSLGMKQRLGIAAALLGDPPVLMFDEPVNGMDPEGVRWARGLFRRLAAEGRTVFLSSHLMAEMASTADRLVVVGRGRLLVAESLRDFAARGGGAVLVGTRDPEGLARALRAAGATVTPRGAGERAGAGRLAVTGLAAGAIAATAARHGIEVHELMAQDGSLEDAFMELTSAEAEYRAGEGR